MESERAKLEARIDRLQKAREELRGELCELELRDIQDECRAALAALDGPAEGMRRLRIAIDAGDCLIHVPPHVTPDWAKHVIIADIPIPIVPVVRGKVQP